MKLKRICGVLLAAILCMTTAAAAVPEVKGAQAVLMEADSGQLLYEKDAYNGSAPSDLTQLMTALVVFEHCPDLDAKVYVNLSAYVQLKESAVKLGLTEGEEITVRELLYAMLVGSADDAANALAEHVAGTQEDFAEVMEKRADELGCVDARFSNANGLPDGHLYASAYDLAVITRELLRYPAFTEIAGAPSHNMQPTNKHTAPLEIKAAVPFLHESAENYYPAVKAAKAGNSSGGGHTLAAVAEQDGTRLIVVTLGADEAADSLYDGAGLLEYGFRGFTRHTFSQEDLQSFASTLGGRTLAVPAGGVSFLLPDALTMEDVQIEEGEDEIVLTAEWEGAKHRLAALSISENAPGTTVTTPNQTEKAEEPAETPAEPVEKEGFSLPRWARYLLGGVGAALVIFLIYYIHRVRRIRAQRARIRAMRYRD